MSKQAGQSAQGFGGGARLLNVLRITAIALLATVGGLSLYVFNVAHWAERQILTTDNWVAVVGPLPRASVVNTALSNKITQEIFANAPVQSSIEDALPPKARFLATPLTSQLQSLTTKVTKEVLASDTFHTVWVNANAAAMDRVVGVARGQIQPRLGSSGRDFNVDLSGIKNVLSNRLGTTSDVVPTLQQATNKAIMINVNLRLAREQIRQVVLTTDLLAVVLPLGIIVSFVGALALAYNRRRLLLTLAMVSIALLLLELISIKIAKQDVLNQVKMSGNKPAVGYVFDVLTTSLKNIVYGELVVTVVVALFCWLAGPSHWAVMVRSWVRLARLKETTVYGWWHRVRLYVKQYQVYGYIAVALLLLVWLAFTAGISTRMVINGALLAILLAEILYITATPRQPA